ncbi:MAG: GNAT family N-acetyltransferase [Pygmaiobacter sp.]
MELRNYQESDREVVGAIWLTSIITAHPFLPEDYWIAEYRTFYHDFLPHADTIVATVDGKVEGFLSFSASGTIAALYVAVCFQKKMHGSLLLLEAKKRYPDGLQLAVYEENERAVRFFETNGFVITKSYPNEKNGKNLLWLRWN